VTADPFQEASVELARPDDDELETEAQLRRSYAQTLQELAETLAASVEFGDLLHEVVVRLVECTGAELALVLATASDERVFYILGSSEDPTAVRLPVNRTAHPEVRRSLEGQEEVWLRDGDETDKPGAEALRWRELGMVWALPLVWKGTAYGALELGFKQEVVLSEALRDLVRQARSLIAFSLRGSELYSSLHEQTRKRATGDDLQRLSEMVHKYEEFFERALDGILVLDRSTRVVHINPAGEQVTGYARHGLVGTPLMDIVVEGDRETLNTVLGRIRAGEYYSFDVGLYTTSGDPILVSVSPSAILEGDEVVVLSFRDVTEARSLETELRSTKEFLERLIDSASDAIVATDVNGQVILFNKGAENLFKMQAADVVGNLYFEDLYPAGAAARVMEELRGPEGGGVGRLKAARKEVLNDNQERVPVSLSANLIYEDGREVGTVAIISDLRERLRIEQRLAQAQEKLVETEKQALIAELAGTTAHELNQPLTSVMGYAELLKRRVPPEDSNVRAVDTILREAERMAEIVRKIGKITRYETKTYVGGTQILDLDKSSKE
jgi:PAS domain S-box-containing protein